MRTLLLAASAIAALGMAAPAEAADIPVKAAPMVVRPACAQFGGFYVGGHVGGAFYDHSLNDRDRFTNQIEDDLTGASIHAQNSGFIGGVQGGYNWQWNCTVFGIEADYSWARIAASAFDTEGSTPPASISFESRLRGIGTIRGRAGVVVDNLLLYVTGGAAYANFQRRIVGTDSTFDTDVFENSRTKWGWTAGFGAEWAIWSNWSIKWETLYARFERDTQTFICIAECDQPFPFRVEFFDSVWTTKLGLNYRF